MSLQKNTKIQRFYEIAILLVLVFFVSPFFTYAQTPRLENNVLLTLDPEFPRSNQDVSVKVESYLFDLNRSNIYWYIDGELKETLSGEKEIVVNTGDVGSSSVVKVVVKTKTNGEITKTLTIRPTEVEILWEATSLVPPFYRGKALNSHETPLKIVAMPNFVINGEKIDPKTLIYKWRNRSTVFKKESGYGKNVLKIKGPQLFRKSFIILEVESLDKKLRAQRTLWITTFLPKVVFYENNPILGIFYKNAFAGSFKMSKDEISIAPFPYFFSPRTKSSRDLKYTWTMNGQEVFPTDNKSILTLRKDGGVSGVSNISLSVQNTRKRMNMQYAKNNIAIEFDY